MVYQLNVSFYHYYIEKIFIDHNYSEKSEKDAYMSLINREWQSNKIITTDLYH